MNISKMIHIVHNLEYDTYSIIIIMIIIRPLFINNFILGI